MSDEETYGLDDELPPWADEVHGLPDEAQVVDDDDEPPSLDGPVADFGPFDPGPGLDIAFDQPFGEVLTVSGGASGLGMLDKGVAKWFSQRPRPFTNCMFASLCTTLAYMGWDVPQTFIADLREASGVPRNKATSTAHTRKAVRKLLPDADLRFGGMGDDELRERLTSGEIAVRVMVRNPDLPQHLREFTGSFPGGHAIALRRADNPQGGKRVRWLDPMGRPRGTYDGKDVDYDDFKDALMRTPSGLVRVTYGRHNSALENPDEPEPPEHGPAGTVVVVPPSNESATVLTRARLDEFVRVPKGTPFLHPRTQEEVTKASEEGNFRIAGRSLDGRFYGAWVNTRRLRGARGLTLLLVEQARVGAPFIE